MATPRLYSDTPQTIRMSTSDIECLEKEASQRNCARADIFRELISDARDCYGLPPALRKPLYAAADQEGLRFREYIAELLRAHAQELVNARIVAGAPEERRRSITIGRR